MDQEKFLNMVKDVSTLEGLKNKLENAEHELAEAEMQRDELLKSYDKEKKDVDRLQKETLSSMFIKLVGKYDEKLDKEKREMLEAKIKYDWACSRVDELNANRERLIKEIRRINRSIREYNEEFKRREHAIMEMEDNELSLRYRKLKDKENELSKQLVEYNEAISAANKACSACDDVLESLHRAGGWATYDIVSRGGLLSYMVKYNHLDMAQEKMNRLNSNLADMNRELKDVNMTFSRRLIEIDSFTRAVDFWFDNIFTDMNVRNTIEENIGIVENLKSNIGYVISKLNDEKSVTECNREQVEEEIRELVIEFGNAEKYSNEN